MKAQLAWTWTRLLHFNEQFHCGKLYYVLGKICLGSYLYFGILLYYVGNEYIDKLEVEIMIILKRKLPW